jgi:hypothetical protein
MICSSLRTRHLSLAACLCAAVHTGPAAAATYSLSVGINDYTTIAPLEGAVADARDLDQTLRASGAAESILLLDADATRARIEAEWKRLTGKAKAGDTFIFTYAGHGGQEPDRAPLDEADGRDEAFLLAAFTPDRKAPGFNERIVDDVFFEWQQAAADKGLKVIIVADSCHSGGGGRNYVVKPTFRFSPPYGEEPGLTFQAAQELAANNPSLDKAKDLPPENVSLFLAVAEAKRSPEILIMNQKRGALSFAVARGIEGEADSDGDGSISAYELQQYVAPQVVGLTEGAQITDSRPLAMSKDGMLKAVRRAPAHPFSVAAIALDVFAEAGPGGPPALRGAKLTANEAGAHLKWLRSRGQVISAQGELVAENIQDAAALQGVVDKWRVVAMLMPFLDARSISFTYPRGSEATYYAAEEISISSSALAPARYVTVLDLAPDGGVEVLAPNKPERAAADERPWPDAMPYTLRARVQAPFGADHVLLIASSKPVAPIFSPGTRLSALALPDLMGRTLEGATFELGLGRIYTGPRTTQ